MLLKLLLNKRYQSRDWLGLWYKILKERGENDLIAFVRRSANKEERYSFSHAIMDGTSSIPFYMEKFGQQNCTPRKMDYIKKFSFIDTVKLTLSNLKVSPISNSIWKERNIQRIEDIFEYSRLTLSKNETLAFNQYCEMNKVSENAILTKLITNEIFPSLENESDTHTWLFPVNVRGMVQKDNNYANHSSFIALNVYKDISIEEIQQNIREELKSFKYLGLWWVHHIGILTGYNYMKKLSLKASQTKFWLGSISNVGKWYTDDNYTHLDNAEKDDAWFFATPGSINFPISFVIMTLNDRMSFSLRVHPGVKKDSLQFSKQVLDNIREKVLFITKS
ncbi:hypothetical protein [Bacteriovorax sp. Seq25_V]|uniref:hypothetical protein n=1 Tax=Bacteriovorax sp. Seq25_V TaxID=1201288 RepID=UPI00038A4A90|nr:hypothetical protein [Bacteriovorax sp. Seq25_V]EQC47695.1 hypothetical protein M900_A0188 [Bacteriovorax sp. Seq25_V]